MVIAILQSRKSLHLVFVLLCCSGDAGPVISAYRITSSPIITAVVMTREQAEVLSALSCRCNNILSLKAAFG